MLLWAGGVKLCLPAPLFPAEQNEDGKWKKIENQQQTIEIKPDGEIQSDSALGLGWNSNGGIRFVNFSSLSNVSFNLPPTLIGDTGLVVQTKGLNVNWDNGDFKVIINEGSLTLPDCFTDAPEIEVSSCEITTKGFSGTVSVDWAQEPRSLEIFGYKCMFSKASFTFERTALISGEILGQLELPYFERWWKCVLLSL